MKRVTRFLTYLFITMLVPALTLAADRKDDGTKPSYRFSGEAELLTHFIDRGLSMTDRNPALNASFLFHLGEQFSFGFWGSNISNVGASEDNLWLKFIGEVRIDFTKDSIFRFYLHDDHYYKSDARNGQEFGFNLEYRAYVVQAEWMTNYQGSRTAAAYFRAAKIFPLYKKIIPSAHVGVTIQRAEGYMNYIDIGGKGTFRVTNAFEFNAGTSAVTNSTQFGDRGDIGYYFGIKLIY